MTGNKKGGGAGLLIAAVLILAAIAAGYFFAGKYREKTSGDGQPSQNTGQQADPGGTGTASGTSSSVLNMMPVDLLFVTNSETGRIENILIGILNCATGKLDYIGIDTEVSCTMSGKLYDELTPGNTELPQTVTFSELYRYYHNDRAYDAGRRIISELINFNIPYYTALEDTVFDGLIYYKKTGDSLEAGFVMRAEELKGRSFGTEGSVKGAIENILEKAVTNWSVSERLRYLEVYDALGETDVTFTDAPVIVKNESTSLDTVGIGAILYGLLY